MPLVSFLDPEHVASFLTLLFLEIVLAGDNLVLIAILSSRLPEHQRPLARRFGLIAAVATRLLLLVSLFWLSHIETPIPMDSFGLKGVIITPRQIVLGVGGLFLLLKSLSEIAAFFEESGPARRGSGVKPASGILLFTIIQIALFDIVFSLDSVIAAIGIARHVEVMVAAIVAAALVMLFLVNPISTFIERHPTLKLIALNFLALVGIILVAEALNIEVDRVHYYLGLAVITVVQLAAFWLLQQARVVRLAVGSLLIAFVGTLAVGYYHHSNNEQSVFNEIYTSTVAALDQARLRVQNSLNWIDQQFSAR
ncbi:MAG: TerC family protein [Micropepsaceae bacterium]